MLKEIQFQTGRKNQELYDCKIHIDEENEPYCLFCASAILQILGIRTMSETLRNKNEYKIKLLVEYHYGIKSTNFINYKGLMKIIVKSRKSLVIDFCNKMNIDYTSIIYTCVESDTLKCIMDAFYGEEMVIQYKINSYLLDLYFPKYKIIVECDDSNHKGIKNIEKDLLRETSIKTIICDCVFVRYDPYSYKFNIFKVIYKIYTIINASNK